MKFNEKLAKLRKKSGLTQEALGLKLNVTRQMISKWELGKETPEMDTIEQISKVFNVSVGELVEINKEKDIENKETKEVKVEDNTIVEDTKKKVSTENESTYVGVMLLLLVVSIALLFLAIVL